MKLICARIHFKFIKIEALLAVHIIKFIELLRLWPMEAIIDNRKIN